MTRSTDSPGAGDLPDADHASAPGPHMLLREGLTGVELAHSALSRGYLAGLPDGDGHPVLVLPGFLAGARSTGFLRGFLRSKGYRVYDWGQGRNMGVRQGLRGRLSARLDHISQRNDRTISIIGWSAGGIYAREIAREQPDRIRSVITMGTPMRGNPRATSAWPAYSLLNRGRNAVDLSPDVLAARAEPLPVPTTCIYSRYDGIVAWELCTSLLAPQTENVEVTSTHLGFGHHRRTLGVIADRLAQPEGEWQPYEPDRAR
ncbi:alpha/beta hydrolase [Nocardioidaceae bacterium]|nr:alpha/beta hydrolase [Nocardioidaceae bacterium]